MTNPDEALFDASSAAAAATVNPGPPPSSPAPEAVKEPLDESGSAQAAQEDYQPAEFDERYKEPFTGLLYLGHLEETFSVWGHTFRIVTPSRMERLQAGELHAPYVGTLAAEIAYQTVLVATFLTDVDGHALPRPVVNDPKENAVRDRFKWVADNLKDPVIDLVYEQILKLDSRVRDTVAAMGEALG